MSLRPGLFLDRDGTINVEVDYLSDPDELVLIPGAADAIRRAREAGYVIIVVTNQSGVARGILTPLDLAAIHARLDSLLAAEGARVDDYFACPHHPEIGSETYRKACSCRKPNPGMLIEAAEKHQLDLGRSALVGDSIRDLEAGRRAGVPERYLVATGKGMSKKDELDPSDHFVADLAEAVDRILDSK